MKDTFKKEEIMDILEKAMSSIEVDTMLAKVLNEPFTQEKLDEAVKNGKLGEAIQKTVIDAIQWGKAVGGLEMFEKFNKEFNNLQ
jgi:hypothetical protein